MCQQYGINSVPNFKIYDGDGKLYAEGQKARDWVIGELRQRQTLESWGQKTE